MRGPAQASALSNNNSTPPSACERSESSSVRRHLPGSYIAIAESDRLDSVLADPGVGIQRVLGSAGDSTFVLIQTDKSEQQMQGSGDFLKVMPNYEYRGDVYDQPLSENPTFEPPHDLPGHLDIVNIGPAWEITKGSPSVISAITDTGVDLQHLQLQDSFWKNPGETAGNGIDEDGNGYVDDIVGWDMSDDDADPHDNKSTHHTHVHGIVHARPGSGKAAGLAPAAKGMALRIAGGKRGYSSAVVAESYLYAMNQGAKSVNTSFNIDGFVGDRALESTYRALADNDVLVFNSAGNSGQLNPRRAAFEDVVLVASTDTASGAVDKRSSFSNYGQGIDIAAPGRDILSTLPSDRSGSLSGTSMASPVAMGVDLLVQSAHPDWNREQRWAQIVGTADNIDSLNPGESNRLGAGRVNAGRALTEVLAPPTLSAREVRTFGGDLSQVVVRLDKVLDTSSANQKEAWRILNSEGESVQVGAPKEVRLLSNEIGFDVSKLPPDSYRLVASASHLKDPFGQALDGNGDGVGGDDFVVGFQIGG